ncbi:G-protein coupled receptor 83-like [Oppia nitens]|uniref:G-protein coupled receptor 83-like n=1 Tax=Oppia nitens TaxID=1686743 RepID=UPI0023DC46E4|nr:G-protein coupled receptor 83-like [Oppia nitens]
MTNFTIDPNNDMSDPDWNWRFAANDDDGGGGGGIGGVGGGDDPIDTEELIRNAALVFFYSLIIVVSLAGNLLVCKVLYDLKESRTTTNVLIVNLAVSDLMLTVLNIPFNIARFILDNWPFGETMCLLVPFIQSTTVHCSSITMMVIAIERYRSLIYNSHVSPTCWPCSRTSSQHQQRLCWPFVNILAVIWSLAALFSLPHGWHNELIEIPIHHQRSIVRCRADYPEPQHIYRQRLTLVTFMSQYVLPILLTCVCYVRIGCFLWRKEIVGNHSELHRLSLLRRKKRRIKMLIVVVMVFAISWMPLQVYHLLADFEIIKYR